MLTDDLLMARFEDATLPSAAFHHAEHVRVAFLCIQRYGMPDALGRFSASLKRFAEAKGKPGLYHETITWAYVFLIAQRVDETSVGDWAGFARDNADLLQWKPSVLDRYYTQETLWSETARRRFVMPDRLGA